MVDTYTELNPGSGGDVMDESEVTYLSSPFTRKRPRVVVSGEGLDDIVPALDAAPDGSEFGLVTRNIPSGTQSVILVERLKKAYDLTDVTSGTAYSYIGSAPVGSDTDAAVWNIRRITYQDGVLMVSEWSDVDVVWDDRVTENYE